ncbi:MAG: hypothetical protein ACE5DN_03130, partial [Flavobacteriales bacterium]
AAQKRYDEDLVKRTAKGLTAKQQFPVIKNYLYNMILKSLDAYHSGSSIDHKLTTLLHHAEILYNRGLFDQSVKILNKAEKPAEKYERFSVLMEIMNWKFRIIKTASFHKISEKEIDSLYQEKKGIAEKIENYQEFGWLHTKLMSKVLKKGWFARNPEEISRDYDPILKHSLFKSEGNAITYRSKIFYYVSKSIYYYLQGRAEDSYAYSSKLLQLFESNPEIAQSYPDDYISGYVNAIFSTMAMNRYAEALQYIKKMQEFEPASVILHARILSASLPELVIYNSSGRSAEVLDILPQFTSRIEKYKHMMSKQEVFYFYYNFACLYFKFHRYREASHYLFNIINDTEVGFLPDIQANARRLTLMVHFELDTVELLPYVLRSTYRFLLQSRRLYKFESAIISFIKKLPGVDGRTLGGLFKELQEELTALSKNAYEKRAIEYFGILDWLRSKTDKK